MSTRFLASRLVAGLSLLLFSVGAVQAEKIKIEKADDLPRHTYEVKGKAVDLIRDPALLLALARAVETDLHADLEAYEIADKTTLKGYYQTLGTIAMMEGRYEEYRELLQEVIALEDKEAQRLLAGLVPLAWIDAIGQTETPFEEAFATALRQRVRNLPYETVEASVKQQKGMMEIVTPTLIEGMAQAQLQPVLDQSGGTLTKDMALGLVGQGFAVHSVLPHKHVIVEVLGEYLDAHAVQKENIWAARDVDLTGRGDLHPVVIAVWDSGVDEPIFAELGQIWTNPAEIAGNGLDDDGNGYVDDVHGIYWDLKAKLTPDPLYPVEEVEDRRLLQARMKGFRDVQMSIDSPEADALKKEMAAMAQSDVQPFLEGVSAYGNHSHGTHVAGIAAHGNPAARLMNLRITFDHKMIPDKPTLQDMRDMADAARRTVEYFVANGVRVANMSWGMGVADLEAALAQHNDPADPQERKALAREMFEILRTALTEAMASAPSVLFVAAAGNSNNDNVFEEMIPSSIDLPNMLTVGAVDAAGDETSFTTFGKVDVYANGFDVMSYVPGGDQLALSGTSMASPNVVNLVGKMLAIDPSLDPTTVKKIIVETAEIRPAGERTVLLQHPARALAAVEESAKRSRR
jgi:hypothetical protein